MNEFYMKKAAVPRSAKDALKLRDSLANWGTDRLLNIAGTCQGSDDPYRKEFGRIHERYANMTFLITQAVSDQHLAYTTETLLHWLEEDFESAATGAQKDAAGICGAELLKILELYN
tara:strand:- start:446 stop:796 length:351 start_codon:yes stop_codon:yes gene_type:complete